MSYRDRVLLSSYEQLQHHDVFPGGARLMSLQSQRLIQIDLPYPDGQQSVTIDLEGYPVSRLAALRVAGGAYAVGQTLDLYVAYRLGARSHIIGLTGEVTLDSLSWAVEFLPYARPMRRGDTWHIVPIWCPLLTPDAQLVVASLESLSVMWISTVTALLEPIDG